MEAIEIAKLARARGLAEAIARPLPTAVSLPGDVEAIAGLVREHECRLVVVDPFSASLTADINTHRDQDVRRAIASLAQLAESECAALLLVAHFNKAQTGDALTRVLGSRGLTAATRSILVFGKAPDAEEGSADRVLAHAACNLAGEAPSLACRVEPRVVEDDVGTIETSRDSTWWEWPRGGHSVKPDAFLDMVEAALPGPYLEMFARRARFGWDYWGDESLGTAEIAGAT